MSSVGQKVLYQPLLFQKSLSLGLPCDLVTDIMAARFWIKYES